MTIDRGHGSAGGNRPRVPTTTRETPENMELIRAVANGSVPRMEAALRAGASAGFELREMGRMDELWGLRFARRDAIYRDAETPVLYAACRIGSVIGNPRLVELLLAHGADPNARFEAWDGEEGGHPEWDTCLSAALPDIEIVAPLLEAGADPNKGPGDEHAERGVLELARDSPEIAALLRRWGAAEVPPSGASGH